jgi:uncharacterized lipoprotein
MCGGEFEMIKAKHVISLIFCFSLASCAPVVFLGGAAAGVAGYKFYEGSLEVIYQAPYMETWDAALRTLERMNIEVTDKKHDYTSGKIEAVGGDEKEIRLSVEYKSAQETEVKIRVGVFGDQSASNVIKDEIRKELFET